MKKFTTLAMILWCGSTSAANYPRVDEDIRAYDLHIARLQQEFAKKPPAPNDKQWVKAKLRHMVDVDQYTRRMTELPERRQYTDEELREFNQRMPYVGVDQQNTADLKELLKIYPWFTISEFGAEVDTHAWLLVQHADHDSAFQRQVLTLLEPLAAIGESNPRNFAYLYDRVASSFQNPAERKPQRYGTQGACTGPGTWEPLPVEDPEKLDERRAAVGLPPMAEYKKGFADFCHESMEDTIRRVREAVRIKDSAAKSEAK